MAKKVAKPTKKPTKKPATTATKTAAKTKTTAKAKPTPKAKSVVRAKPAVVAAPPAPTQPAEVAKPAAQACSPALPSKNYKISARFTNALTRHLERLDDKKICADAVSYVLEGDPPDVLLRLGKIANIGDLLALAGVSNKVDYKLRGVISIERMQVYRAAEDIPPAVWSRLGEVFSVSARAAGRKGTTVSLWQDWLCALIGELMVAHRHEDGNKGAVFPAETLLPIFAEAKLPVSEAIRLIYDQYLLSSLRMGAHYYSSSTNELFSGWPELLSKNAQAVREILGRSNRSDSALRVLNELKFDFTPVIDLVAKLATLGAKGVRDLTLPVLDRHKSTAIPLLEKLLSEGNAGQRNEAATLLLKLEGDRAADKLRKQLKNEPSDKVKQTIERLLSAPPEVSDESAPELALPPLKLELGEVALPGVARVRLKNVFQKAHEQAIKRYEQELAAWNAPDRPSWKSKPTKPEPLAAKDLDELCEFISGSRKTLSERQLYRRMGVWNTTICDESFAPPGVHLIHVVRMSNALHRFDLERSDEQLYWNDTSDLDAYRAMCDKPFGLREVETCLATLPNARPGMVVYAYLQNNNKYRDFCDWEPEAIWPAFAERIELLRNSITGVARTGKYDYYLPERKRNAFKVLATFPKLPPGFVSLLWDMALGDTKSDRAPAQAALRSLPDKAKRVAMSLTNGRQTIREAAAEWLGNIGDQSVIPALKDTFRKEKLEATKGIIMVALEKLDADVSEFLDRKALQKEADEGMKTPGRTYSVELDKLPPIHWQDTGKPVDPKIVQWWVVQAIAQNSPACGPILRRYLAMCRPLDTTALAKFILTGWLERGSARGLLAFVSAAADADCVRMSEKYIKTWYGQKMSQCKSLIEMLAWVKHPMALQVLLSIANRFRTRSLREFASQLVTAVAEREGWTIDELADRTIPDGGFTKLEGGGKPTLVLDYGARQFTATLDDELEPVLAGEGGKIVRALPAPAKADDPVKAKEAKKIFSDAKKQIKDVVKRQSERLYEALCTQRAWNFADWKQYLADHPVVGQMCVRLAWSAFTPGENGKFLGCFRPLEDGSLTNEKDDAVTFPPETIIRLAHTANTPPEHAATWKQHFVDYKVEPVFGQFGRATFTLPEAKAKETAITDFRGYEIGTFQMRGRLTKLGYVRGEAQDGSWFHEYLKPFRSLGIQAEIGFTGNSLPEEDRRAALGSLTFVKIKPDGEAAGGRWNSKPLELGKVPPVLLSECYNDLKQLAGEGTGFNPDWEKRDYY
jgi:HEAT repeat protein